MFSKLFYNNARYTLVPISSFLGKDPDDIPVSQLKIEPNEFKETGWNRLRNTFSIDEFGNISPEVNSILQVGMVSMLCGGIYGGFLNSRDAYIEFVKTNNATTFKTHFEAKKKMQDHMTVSFAKGAFRLSWRIALFSMSFMTITTAIQVYRKKYGITEYVAGGGLGGALYKFNMGPRAWVAGGVVGSALGFMCGALTCGLLKMAGTTLEETYKWRYRIRESRRELRKKTLEKHFDENEFAIIKIHNDEIGKAGHTIDALSTESATS